MNAVLARLYDLRFNELGAGHPLVRYHYRRIYEMYGKPLNFMY
jgi:hypothetical protein